jgi:drug/metabolite transporter (DMT)-like permease
MHSESTRRGYLFAGLTVAIWAGFILVSRVGGTSALGAHDITALRFAVAAAVLLPVWLFSRRFRLFDRRTVALSLCGGFGYSLIAYSAFRYAPAAHAAILMPGMLPFEMTIIAWWLLGERPGRVRVIALGLIAIGVAALAVETFSATRTAAGSTWIGDLLFVTASTSWALYTVLARRWGVAPLDTAIGVTLVSAALYLPVYVLFMPMQIASAPLQTILVQAVYQGLLVSIVALLLYMKAMTLIGPTRLGSFMALVPALAGISAVPVLGEPLSGWLLAGLAMVSLGAFVSTRTRLPFFRGAAG